MEPVVEIVEAGRDGKYSFIVSAYLDAVDADVYKACVHNSHSALRRDGNLYSGAFKKWRNRKKVLDALFSDKRTLHLRTCALYSIFLRSSYAECASDHQYPDKYRDYIPSPHIQYYSDVGWLLYEITTKLRESDVMGAVLRCIASTCSLDFTNEYVVSRFLNDFFNSQRECIMLPDGRFVDPEKALQYIKREGNA